MKKVSVYGIGNFGYALLKHLDNKNKGNFNLHAYDKNSALVEHLDKERSHLHLHKDQKVSEKIVFEKDIEGLLKHCDVLILAITSSATREVVREIKKYITGKIIIVNTAKALDRDTGKRVSEIIKKELRGKEYEYVLFAGGTIAKDLFAHEPLGVTIACEDTKSLTAIKELFEFDNLFVYPTKDVIGSEYASVFKNVISILAGITHGLGFSYGAETHIISRASAEVEDFVIKKLGGKKKTFEMGSQCWGNDLWMSCTGNTRNRGLGILIGQGVPIDKALSDIKTNNTTVEGVSTVLSLGEIKGIKKCYIINLIFELFIKKVDLKKFKEMIFKNNF